MDRIAEWRPVDPAGPDGTAETSAAEEAPGEAPEESPGRARPGSPATATSWRYVAPALIGFSLAGLAIAAAIVLVVLSSMPKPAVAIDSVRTTERTPFPAGSSGPVGSAQPVAGELVVDVEGAVQSPGAWSLPAGSRVGDAIRAAGGYSEQIDIDAASKQLNLAEPLADGQQIHVPLRGEAEAAAADSSTGGSPLPPGNAPGNGLIDINSASQDELESLPGIGPVTAGKLIAAREEAPFTSVDQLQQRGVVGQATLEKIRALVTVGP